ncbi:amidase [Nocardia sp. CA-128927]|uniref:amidase n=1 Tax=Nocardia sp. CA-128927 TaxID=3239975 RepID=UPI003D96BA1D
MKPYELTASAASAAIHAKEISPVELVDSVLGRIDQVQSRLGAYVTVTADRARRAAHEAETEIAAGRSRGPLHGIPMGLKDLIDVAGIGTTASSRVRSTHRAEADSAVAANLSAAGAVLLGKTHTHEFAYGLITPQTRNARNPTRVAGGSSGGSAVAVAAGAATFAVGTDTGGSIRVPAALNGVVGLKPTYGRISRHGVVPLSWSLDHIGPITRTVADAALVLTALTGYDPRDPASVPTPAEDLTPPDLTRVRIGIPTNYYFDHVDPETTAAVWRAIDHLRDLGAQLVDVEIPMTRYIHATQWGLMVPEASSYHEQTLRTSGEQYGDDVRVLLEAGELLSAGDYLRAQRARTMMRSAWADVLANVDVIAAPSVPITAVRVGQQTVTWPDGTSEAIADAYVRLAAPANITGIPALSLPVGRDRMGLPIGMQLLGHPFGEAALLRVGQAYEQTASPQLDDPLDAIKVTG